MTDMDCSFTPRFLTQPISFSGGGGRRRTSALIRIIAVGRLRGRTEAALFERYATRIRPPLSVTELDEGADMLAALPARAFTVALDQGGRGAGQRGLRAAAGALAGAGTPGVFYDRWGRWVGGGRPAAGRGTAVSRGADLAAQAGSGHAGGQIYRARMIAAGIPITGPSDRA